WSVNGNEIATGVNPTVVLPEGSTTGELTVTDDDGATDTDSVVIMINSPDNVAPVGDAGPHQTLTDTDDDGEEEVTLDGSGSTDSNGEIVTYSWLVNGNEIATGVNPTVVLPVGSTTVVLTVTDDDGATDTDSVVIMINSPGNMAPIADAGPNQTLTDTNDGDEEEITLDGSGSTDPDGEIVAYSWSVNETEIATGVNPTVVLPIGSTTVELTVTDDDGATDTDSVVIMINSPDNVAPVADAGPDQTIMDTDADGEEEVTLDGSGSTDSGGEIVTYIWSVEGTEIATGIRSTVVLPIGSTTLILTVTDDNGATDTDSVVILIENCVVQAPEAIASQEFCSLNSPSVGDIDITGENINWFADADLTTPINSSDLLVNEALYYAVSTENGCTSDAIAVTVNIIQATQPPIASANQSFCLVDNPTVADLDAQGAEGTELIWYSDAAL